MIVKQTRKLEMPLRKSGSEMLNVAEQHLDKIIPLNSCSSEIMMYSATSKLKHHD